MTEPKNYVAVVEAHQDRIILDGHYYATEFVRKALRLRESKAVAWFVSGPQLSTTVYAHEEVEVAIKRFCYLDKNSASEDYTATALYTRLTIGE